MRKSTWWLGAAMATVAFVHAPDSGACTYGGCPNWPSDCYNLKDTLWCPDQSGISHVTLTNYGSYEAAFDWARAELSDPHNGIGNALELSQVGSGGKIRVYDYSGSADWWGLADQYVTSNGTCMSSARIQINKSYMSSTVRKQYTMLHEMGHTLGLNHVCVCPRTMNPCGTCGDDGNGATPYLKSCDAKGIAAIYPPGAVLQPEDEELLYQSHLYDEGGHSDLDGDGDSDVCARSASGLVCHLAGPEGFSEALEGPALADDSGWADSDNATTLRLLDLDGDGRADLCARANAGVRCWRSTGEGFSSAIVGPELADDGSWDEPMYFTTLRAADFDGDGRDDLCARAAKGLVCFPSLGSGFGAAVAGPPLSNEAGWDAPFRYGSLRMGDVDGSGTADVCARDASGVRCWLSDGRGFSSEIAGPSWTDEGGWTEAMYYATIRLADVDGDGKADLCARASDGFRCHLSEGDGFGPARPGPSWSTESGWGDDDNYTTIRLGDLDADGDLDVCARANAGIVCARWEQTAFGPTSPGPAIDDDKGWDGPEYFRTLRLADVDGDRRADLCARAGKGFGCWRSDGTGFGEFLLGPPWSDAAGWDDPKYYATIRIAGTARSSSEGGGHGGPAPPGSSSNAGAGGANGISADGGEDGGCNAAASPRSPRASAVLLLVALLAGARASRGRRRVVLTGKRPR